MPIFVEWASASETGRVRRRNEDAVLASPPIFAVADGLGGHDRGEVASDLVMTRLAALSGLSEVGPEMVVQAILSANLDIRDRTQGSTLHMGTTVVGLAIARAAVGDRLLIFNVGDSRAYRLNADLFEQISVDHSVVAELVRAGNLSAAAAETHPHRHVVTRALGFTNGLNVDTWLIDPVAGDRFLLCSDGLTNELPSGEIEAILRQSATPDIATEALVSQTMSAGARDNVSVVVVFISAVTAESGEGDAETSPRTAVAARPTTLIGDVPGQAPPLKAQLVPDADLISWVPGRTDRFRGDGS